MVPVKKFRMVTTFVVLGSNLGAMLFFIFLISQIAPNFTAEQENFLIEHGMGVLLAMVVGNIVPYIVPFAFINFYLSPIVKWIKARKRDPQIPASEKVQRRVQNVPLITALLGALGWLIAYIGLMVINLTIRVMSPTAIFHWGVFSLIQFVSAALLTFVIGFFLMEYLNRKWFIPQIFPQGKLTAVPRVIRISIKVRFLLFAFAISFYPLVFIAGGLRLAPGKVDVLGFFALTFLPLGLVLTILVSKFFQKPLVEMEVATQEIRKENYEVNIKVASSDELGHLGEGINSMALGLKEKVFIKDTFGKMVDPAVRDHLLSGNLNLGGGLTPAAILFADLRDFTPMAESLAPDQVVSLLNRFFARMNEAISSEGGLVNKFMGDAVMALFNVPIPQNDYGLRAFHAAIKMQVALVRLNEEFQSEGLPVLRMGIGLHCGVVLAGNIGSPQRMEYTVIGDPVNAASRLESLNKDLSSDLLISGDLKALLPEAITGVVFVHKGKASVKGKSREIEVWAIQKSP